MSDRHCNFGTACWGSPSCTDTECPGHPCNRGPEEPTESEQALKDVAHAVIKVAVAACVGITIAAWIAS